MAARQVYNGAKWVLKNAAKTGTGIVVASAIRSGIKGNARGSLRGGGAHATQPGHSGWAKGSSRKRKSKSKGGRGRKRTSKKTKCVTRRDVLRMINKKDEMPIGEKQVLVAGGCTVYAGAQTVFNTDTNGRGFVVDYNRIWDAASTMYNGKTPGFDPFVTTGNFAIDMPLKAIKNYAEFRMVNNALIQLEIDMYVSEPKIMTSKNFADTWQNCYTELAYSSNGNYTNQKSNDYYANPAQLPNLKKFYRWTKTTFNLLPGETRKEIVKGPTKKFMPQDYMQPGSTIGAPNPYFYVPGTKEVTFVVRTILGNTTVGNLPRHLASSTLRQFLVEILYRVEVECPEVTPVAQRVRALEIDNYQPLISTPADGTGIVAQVYNPVSYATFGT